LSLFAPIFSGACLAAAKGCDDIWLMWKKDLLFVDFPSSLAHVAQSLWRKKKVHQDKLDEPFPAEANKAIVVRQPPCN
jgi:hypothetical protein